MTQLFLCSSFADVAKFLPDCVKNLQGMKVAFIPTAAEVEKVTFYVKKWWEALENLGMQITELNISTTEASKIKNTIENADCIYVSGGNTFYLVQELKKTGTDELIKQHILAGKLYIGESAGAVITAPNIEYVSLMDDPEKGKELSSFAALNVVDFSTVPHLWCFPFEKATKEVISRYGESLTLKAISNTQALRVDEEGVKTLE